MVDGFIFPQSQSNAICRADGDLIGLEKKAWPQLATVSTLSSKQLPLEMRSSGALRVPRHFSNHIRIHICSSRPGCSNATRCASTSLRPLQSHQLPLDRRWQQRRQASVAAAVYVFCLLEKPELIESGWSKQRSQKILHKRPLSRILHLKKLNDYPVFATLE